MSAQTAAPWRQIAPCSEGGGGPGRGVFVIWMSSALYSFVLVRADCAPSPHRANGGSAADNYPHNTHTGVRTSTHTAHLLHTSVHMYRNIQTNILLPPPRTHPTPPAPPLPTPELPLMNTRCFYSPRTKGSSSAAQPSGPTALPPTHCGRPINALTTFLNMWQKYINREFMGTRLAAEGRESCVMHLFRGFSRGAESRCERRSPAEHPGDFQSLKWGLLRVEAKCGCICFFPKLGYSIEELAQKIDFSSHKSQFSYPSCSVFLPQHQFQSKLDFFSTSGGW